jgi:alkylation response protein AidB-like acyl-CoA dehydrogenase
MERPLDDDVLEQLAATVNRFARAGASRAREFRGAQPGYSATAWSVMAKQGWLSTLVCERHGGLGLGIMAAATVSRQLGRFAVPEPFVAVAVLAASCLDAVADEAHWSTRLGALMSGELVASVGWQDRLGAIDIGKGGVVAHGDKLQIELNGAIRFAAVPSADAFIVHATGPRAGLYWVPRDASGLAIQIESCPDGSALAMLALSGVTLGSEDCLAKGAAATRLLRRAIDVTLVACAAELLGVMDGALEMTLEYLRARKQFGVAIGSFQSLQHRAVDLWMHREICEAAVNAAALVLDDLNRTPSERGAAASGAKARAAQSAVLLCNQALQLHGAIGFADEYGLGLLLNRALTLAAWAGNAAQHRQRFGILSPLE